MKRFFMFFLICLISFFAHQSYAQDEVASETITPFFNALKSGDTTKLLQYIDGPLYQRNIVLLKQNSNYSNLLKKKYNNARFQIVKISNRNHEELLADIRIIFSSGNTVNRKLILQKNEGSNSWKIVDEIRS